MAVGEAAKALRITKLVVQGKASARKMAAQHVNPGVAAIAVACLDLPARALDFR